MKIGIVGAGAMALRFLKAVGKEVSGVEFVAVYDVLATQLSDFGQLHPRMRTYSQYDDLLDDPQVDAVYIATPVHTHRHLSVQAAQAGKHILCEKPMAVSLEDCQAMVASAETHNVTLQIGYMMRFHPSHRYIKQAIQDGVLGEIQFAHIERTDFFDFKSADIPHHRMWFVDKSKSGGGAFMDLGCHLIDLLMFLVGDQVSEVNFLASPDEDLGVELSGLASVSFQRGAVGTVFASWQVPLNDNILQIYGDKASVQAIRTIGPYKDGRVEIVIGDRHQVIEIPYENHYVLELAHFRDSAATGTEPVTSGRNCLNSEALRIRLYDSLSG
jgi:predicted dehydrogenase